MRTKYALLVLVSLAGFSCSPDDPPGRRDQIVRFPQPATPTESAQQPYTTAELRKARIQWGTYCFQCHGPAGKGDGPAGITLDPPPRDLSNPEWQDSVDDEYILRVIRDGGASVGMSGNMLANPTYRNQEGVLRALVAMVRKCRAQK